MAAVAGAWHLAADEVLPREGKSCRFALQIDGALYCPSEFLGVTCAEAAATVPQRTPLMPPRKLMFCKRMHGTLGDRLALEAMSSRHRRAEIHEVVALAEAVTSHAA